MQSFSETLVYRSMPASVFIPMRTWPMVMGSDGLMEATSKDSLSDDFGLAAMQHETSKRSDAYTIQAFMPSSMRQIACSVRNLYVRNVKTLDRQLVARALDRQQEARVARVSLDLFAQPRDVHVHRAAER